MSRAVELDESWLSRPPSGARLVFDRHGKLIREVPDARHRFSTWRSLDTISRPMQRATLYAEDRRFYRHHGVDLIAVARSLWINLLAMEVRTGASTITQQTIKLMRSRPHDEHALEIKLKEMMLAMKLEARLDKDDVLEHYLNRVPYGNQRFGVEAAARHYFACSAEELDWSQAAFLAALPRAPSTLDPRRSIEPARRVQRVILARLLAHGQISAKTYEDALAQPIILAPKTASMPSYHHVTTHLLDTFPARNHITSTLDTHIQRTSHDLLVEHLEHLARSDVSQAAALVISTQTGEVLASIGSRDPFGVPDLGANDGVFMRRRPGSTLKPFVYAAYLEAGGTLADPIADVPTTLPTELGSWSPQNFDRRYHGPVSVRDALGSSLNLPAVLVAHWLGSSTVVERLRAFGFSLPERDHVTDGYGAGIALGNAEVSLFELAQAYAVLGRAGTYKPLTHDLGGSEESRQIMSPEVAFLILDVLADDHARIKGFGRGSALDVPFFMAAKTGTSTGFRDAWAVGITPEHTVAVWVGNFDGSRMDRVSGGSGAAPLLRALMTSLQERSRADHEPAPPEGLWRRRVCTTSGQDATRNCACPYTNMEWFRRPTQGSSGHLDVRGRHVFGHDRRSSCPMHRMTSDGERALRVPGSWRGWLDESEGRVAFDDASGQAWVTHPIRGDLYMAHSAGQPAKIELRAAVQHAGPLWWWVDGKPWRRAHHPYVTHWNARVGPHRLGIGTSTELLHEVPIDLVE